MELLIFIALVLLVHWLAAQSDLGGCIVSVLLCIAAGLATSVFWAVSVPLVSNVGEGDGAYAGLAGLGFLPIISFVFPLLYRIILFISTAYLNLRARRLTFLVLVGLCVLNLVLLFVFVGQGVLAEFVVFSAPISLAWIVYSWVMHGRKSFTNPMAPEERAS